MKAIKTILLLLAIVGTTYSQTDCRPYVPTNKGATWEITNYNAKGKVQGTVSYELLDKVVSDNDVTFKIKSVAKDKKGKDIYTNEFSATCKDGKFDFGMAFKMDGNQLQAYEDMDVQVDASKFEIPDMDAPAGTTLDDGTLAINVDTGMIAVKMNIEITDRKVEKREELTTPAGTFDCIVLTQTIYTKMMIKVTASSKEWYSENVGMVRSESYNKKGKLMGYSELTKLDN